ncbi:CDP-glycerol glycerophosphotransferase family protein, partial [Vibrio alginolyticus]|uniref:CDP-glycerol glycerophosphotransferase family protein n=2 Tax=Vibrio TaxID=662 RepID=UPI00215CA81A
YLNNYDVLITDYSSVYIDYLLTDKPIIFVNGDIDSYLTEDRELYYDYNSVTPGIKCSTWNDVISAIEIIKTRGDTYHAERQKVRDCFHFYYDGNSSQRVFNCIYDRFM